MTVYVDSERRMFADTPDEAHAMAARVGLSRRNYQAPHYRICLTRRARAIYHGAVAVDRREALRIIRNITLDG